MDIDPQTFKQTAPGLLGAIGAIFFLQGPWYTRIGLIVPGGALSFYAYEDLAKFSGMSPGLAGFTVGILGMIFLGRVVEAWYRLDITGVIGSVLRKWFGVKE